MLLICLTVVGPLDKTLSTMFCILYDEKWYGKINNVVIALDIRICIRRKVANIWITPKLKVSMFYSVLQFFV